MLRVHQDENFEEWRIHLFPHAQTYTSIQNHQFLARCLPQSQRHLNLGSVLSFPLTLPKNQNSVKAGVKY